MIELLKYEINADKHTSISRNPTHILVYYFYKYAFFCKGSEKAYKGKQSNEQDLFKDLYIYCIVYSFS